MLTRKLLGLSLALGLGTAGLLGGMFGQTPEAEAHRGYHRRPRVSFNIAHYHGYRPYRGGYRYRNGYRGRHYYRNRGRSYGRRGAGRGCPTQIRGPRAVYY